MKEPNEVRFERTRVEWALSILQILVSAALFVRFYPANGFVYGDKAIIYLTCFFIFLFLMAFYRTFLRPYALRLTPEGDLLIQSVFFPKRLAVEWIESLLIIETADPKVPKKYTLQVKDGDPLEVPSLGDMPVFIERLTAMNPRMAILTVRPPENKG